MGYTFKLEKVLNYKETMEDFKKAEYGDVNQKLNREEKILYDYNLRKQNLVKDKSDSSKKTNIGNLKLYNNYLQEISKNIEKQEDIIDETKEELAKVKDELMVAMQEKKSFEKLKEKDYNEYIDESKKKEDKIIDGIVTFNINTQQ
jgi:flagellar FliJ protein